MATIEDRQRYRVE